MYLMISYVTSVRVHDAVESLLHSSVQMSPACNTIASSVGHKFMRDPAESFTSLLLRRVLTDQDPCHFGGVEL